MKFIRTLKSRNGKPVDFVAIESEIENICQEFGILLFYVFGSYAQSFANKLSDLDIAFLSREKFDLHQLLEFLSKLQDIFEEEAVDLIDLRESPPALTHRVLKEGKCMYAKSLQEKIEFEIKNESLYFDMQTLRNEHFISLRRRIENGTFGYR